MSQQIPERFSGGAIDLSHLAARASQPAGAPVAPTHGDGQTVDVPSLVIDVTDQMFEQVAQLSSVVPVVIDLWAEWCQPCKTLTPILEKLVNEFAGQLLLAKVDVDANPGLAQAFQAQSIPTVVALVGGRPVPLFQGAMPEQQVREVFSQLIELAKQHGVTGQVNAPIVEQDSEEPEQAEQINPAHSGALEALDKGDYSAAVREYEQVLAKAPADQEARAALVQVRLLERLQAVNSDEARDAAAAQPDDVEAQLRVADLDVSGGHIEDAFARLLELFSARDLEEDRTRIRERLLELFEVVGVADPRVIAARARLANLLY